MRLSGDLQQIGEQAEEDVKMRAGDVERWMQDYVAKLLGVPPLSVSTDDNFDALGLDSASAVALVGDLEDWLEIELNPVMAYDYPTIRLLSAYVVGEGAVETGGA